MPPGRKAGWLFRSVCLKQPFFEISDGGFKPYDGKGSYRIAGKALFDGVEAQLAWAVRVRRWLI